MRSNQLLCTVFDQQKYAQTYHLSPLRHESVILRGRLQWHNKSWCGSFQETTKWRAWILSEQSVCNMFDDLFLSCSHHRNVEYCVLSDCRHIKRRETVFPFPWIAVGQGIPWPQRDVGEIWVAFNIPDIHVGIFFCVSILNCRTIFNMVSMTIYCQQPTWNNFC